MTTTALLRPGTVYVTTDGFACSDVTCCGSTALYTGRDLHGHYLREVQPGDIAEWAAYGIGPLTCECGRVTAL